MPYGWNALTNSCQPPINITPAKKSKAYQANEININIFLLCILRNMQMFGGMRSPSQTISSTIPMPIEMSFSVPRSYE